MKKHILGFAIFSLIVGLAVFVSVMFYKSVKKEYVYEVSRKYCQKDIPQNSNTKPAPVKIVQAVFNLNTKQLNVLFSTPYQQDAEVTLTYFRRGALDTLGLDEVRKLKLVPDFENKSNQVIYLPDNWVKNLKSTDTMYIWINHEGVSTLQNINEVPVLLIQQ